MKRKIFFMALATIASVSLVSCDEDTYIQNDPIARGYKFLSPTRVMLYDRNDVEVEEREIEVTIKIQDDQYLSGGEVPELVPTKDEDMQHTYNLLFTGYDTDEATLLEDGSLADVFHYEGLNNYLRIYGLQIEVEGANGKETLVPLNILMLSAEIEKVSEDEVVVEYDIKYSLQASPNDLRSKPFEIAQRVQKVYITKGLGENN